MQIKANIQTFMDHKLHKGEQISAVLLRTIKESKICVVVFSRDYVSSTWCLDELVKILECKDKYGRIVIPIFYNVDPSNVRKQSESYGDTFAKLKQRFEHNNKDKVQMWSDALTQASSLSGWDSRNIRSEPKLIKAIVKDILSKLNHMSSSHFEGLVGIHRHVEKIEGFLSEVRTVGIWGMGGIGKTTLARVVFHKLKEQFESFSMIENAREQLSRIGLEALGEKFLRELLKHQEIDTYSMRSNFVKHRLERKKILVVLDDVDNSIQAQDLINVCDWFGEGSKIIITSRDRQVLKNASASRTYHVERLDLSNALKLFSLKAFKQDEPTQNYMELSKWVASNCQGNPLALVVLGCFLHGRRKQEWKSALEKLKQAPHKDIFNVLKLSFDGLDDLQKNMFLDLACFLRETDKISMDFIGDYYDSYASVEISVLKERSLVLVDNKLGYIEMHDLIKEMGQEITKQQLVTHPRKPIRLWKHEDIYRLFKNNDMETESIRYICLDVCKTKEIILKSNVFQKMYDLRFLKFYKSDSEGPSQVHICEEGLDNLPEELRILYWAEYPSSCVPLKFCAENLVNLKMPNSHLQQLWDGNQVSNYCQKIFITPHWTSSYISQLSSKLDRPQIKY